MNQKKKSISSKKKKMFLIHWNMSFDASQATRKKKQKSFHGINQTLFSDDRSLDGSNKKRSRIDYNVWHRKKINDDQYEKKIIKVQKRFGLKARN